MSTGEKKSIWCVVANVMSDPHPEGPDGEHRLGMKHFAPGAKLYCFRSEWGDGGERLRVLGRHRGGGPKLFEIVISTRWLTNWRPQQVFHPYVVHVMTQRKEWDSSEESFLAATKMAEWFKTGPGQP